MHQPARLKARKVQKFKPENRHRPRGALQFNPLARIFVQRLAVALEGRIHGRDLLYLSAEILQHGFEPVFGNPGKRRKRLKRGMTGQVSRVGLFAEPYRRMIGVVGIRSEEHTSELQSLMRLSSDVL